MKKCNKVFVCQDMGFDFSDAEENFGELVVLLPKNASVFGSTSRIKKSLWYHGFDDDSYLLAVGSPLAMMQALHCAMQIVKNRVQILQWDRVARHYKLHEIRK